MEPAVTDAALAAAAEHAVHPSGPGRSHAASAKVMPMPAVGAVPPRAAAAMPGGRRATAAAAMPSHTARRVSQMEAEDMVQRRRQVLHRSGYSYEQLEGDDFLQTPWVPPKPQMANRSRRSKIFKNGDGKLWRTSVREMDELGVGISLYFRLVRALGCTFVLMAVVLLPTVYVAASGSALFPETVDVLRTARTTIANVGTPKDLSCTTTTPHPTCSNVTDIDVPVPFSDPIAASPKLLSLVFVGCDVLAALVFILFLALFHGKIELLTMLAEGNVVTASSYSVLVRGLPVDATELEVLQHFNRLYDLGAKDWVFGGFWGCLSRKRHPRPPIHSESRGAMKAGLGPGRKFRYSITDNITSGPVLNATNTGNPMYLRTYIAEVVLCHPIGQLLRSYTTHTKLLMKLRSTRAAAKKFSKASVHRNKAKYTKAIRALDKLNRKIEATNAKYAAKDTKDVCAAFVTFNCEDSLLRCLHDYHNSSSWLGRKLQPIPLRFRKGTFPLQVERAPEPTDIIWEHIETTDSQRRRRVCGVYALVVFILLVSTALVYAVTLVQERYVEEPPKLVRCLHEVRAAVYNTLEYPRDAELQHIPELDATCPPNSVYLFYNSSTAGPPPYVWTAAGNATGNATGNTPANAAGCNTPCAPLGGDTECSVLDTGSTFPAADIANCFCSRTLGTVSVSEGLLAALDALYGVHGDVCSGFADRYTQRMFLALLAALVVVAVNIVLDVGLKAATSFERHLSITQQSKHLMVKVFTSQFVNTALVTLVVGAQLPAAMPTWLRKLEGDNDDFTVHWYTDVGASLVLTMVINIVAPHMPVVGQFVMAAFARRRAAKTAMCQAEMDARYTPPPLNISIRMSEMLNTAFVCLFYASGMPIMVAIAALTFIMQYWFDKWALLRQYRRPPRLSNQLVVMAVRLLPYALLLHLAVAVWMFGSPEVLPSYKVRLLSDQWTDQFHSYLERLGSWGVDPVDARVRLARAAAFPAFVLFAVAGLALLVYNTVGGWAVKLLRRLCCLVSCGKACRNRKRLQRFNRPMFTAPYAVQLDESAEKLRKKRAKGMDQQRAREGWQSVVDPNRPGVVLETKVWMAEGKSGGVRHRRGERMLTWQVIKDMSLPTYDIVANPVYSVAVSAIQATSMQRRKSQLMGANGMRAMACAEAQIRRLSAGFPAATASTAQRRPSTTGGIPSRRATTSALMLHRSGTALAVPAPSSPGGAASGVRHLPPLHDAPELPAHVFADLAEAAEADADTDTGVAARSRRRSSNLAMAMAAVPAAPVRVRRVPAGAVQVDVSHDFARDFAAADLQQSGSIGMDSDEAASLGDGDGDDGVGDDHAVLGFDDGMERPTTSAGQRPGSPQSNQPREVVLYTV